MLTHTFMSQINSESKYWLAFSSRQLLALTSCSFPSAEATTKTSDVFPAVCPLCRLGPPPEISFIDFTSWVVG